MSGASGGKRIARKQYKCDGPFCEEPIMPGEEYTYLRFLPEMVTRREHTRYHPIPPGVIPEWAQK